MKNNFTQRYAKGHWLFDEWMTKQYSPFFNKNGRKSLNARKTLRRWAKNLRRKAENIIAPIKFED
jgi:hypothetical protein